MPPTTGLDKALMAGLLLFTRPSGLQQLYIWIAQVSHERPMLPKPQAVIPDSIAISKAMQTRDRN